MRQTTCRLIRGSTFDGKDTLIARRSEDPYDFSPIDDAVAAGTPDWSPSDLTSFGF